MVVQECEMGEVRVTVEAPDGMRPDVSLNFHPRSVEESDRWLELLGGPAAFDDYTPGHRWLSGPRGRGLGTNVKVALFLLLGDEVPVPEVRAERALMDRQRAALAERQDDDSEVE